MLEQKEKELEEQIAAWSRSLADRIALLQKQIEIQSSFRGRILRIVQEPAAGTILYSIFYREDNEPMNQ